jgi:quercetin dioxygenase-like cupin family protein
MKVTRATETTARRADPAYFTGEVWQEPIGTTPTEAPVAALLVHFAPAARTHWHTHPAGQTLHVLAGVGIVQSRGGAARRIRPGDSVWIEPGEEHWHGAAAGHPMTHVAMQHVVDGSGVAWLGPVTEAEHAAAEAEAADRG